MGNDLCNRCGRWCRRDDVAYEHRFPAKDGNYYGTLCLTCKTELEDQPRGQEEK